MSAMRFETKAKLGYALLIVLFAGVMAYAIGRMSSAAGDQMARIRYQEKEITLVERLRGTAQLVVAQGRAYLFSGDRDMYALAQNAQHQLEEELRWFTDHSFTSVATSHVSSVERTAASFWRVQDELMAARA